MTRQFVANGLPLADAKANVTAAILGQSQKLSLLDSYNDLFSILMWLGVITLAASIGKMLTGKGRALRRKEEKAQVKHEEPLQLAAPSHQK
ncbi:hypothetical protein [Metabacillus sp. RGM 3146]|uniref:hypothetical protein n=1 Tax=Metabacillus sp. RGM 3146 TaxID=3401092 RepID=UPI003B98EAA2